MTVTIDDEGAKAKVGGGSGGQARLRRARAAIVDRMAADTKALVPMMRDKVVTHGGKKKNVRGGALRRSVDTGRKADGIISWRSRVARRMYYAPRSWRFTTPGTGPQWVERAKATHGEAWSEAGRRGLDG